MNSRTWIAQLVLGPAVFLHLLPGLAVADLAEAELVTVVNQVNLGSGGDAKPNDKIAENTPLTTGASSFAEIKFQDSSLLRLSPETRLSFLSKDRTLKLEKGAFLVNVPKGKGGIQIEADSIRGEVTGTTLMASRDSEGNFGLVILETTGSAKVTSNTGQTASLTPGQIALVRKSDGSIRVFEINLDAVVQFSPLFVSFPRPMAGLENVMSVADGQASEVKSEIKFLLSYSDVGLTEQDPDKSSLSLLFGKSPDEMVVSKNTFLGELSTAAGKEAGGEMAAGTGVVLGGESMEAGSVSDARQPKGEEIASNSNPPTGDAAGGLGDTDTAAGGESLGATDTAAGGGGGAGTGGGTSGPVAPVGGGTTVNNPRATPI